VIDLDGYEAAGLYRPDEAVAAEVRGIITLIEGMGWTPSEIVESLSYEHLLDLVGDTTLSPKAELSFIDAAKDVGVGVEELDVIRRTVGLVKRPLDEPMLSKDAIEALVSLRRSTMMFSGDEADHFTRVLGSSLGRIAEAAVSLFLIDVEGPLRSSGGNDLDVVRENLRVAAEFERVTDSLGPLLRMHLDDAIERSRISRDPTDDALLSRLAVGFVDLVGFTAYSDEATAEELGLLVRRFEDTAYDLVAENGGRVVKLIGDEVMFVAADAHAACVVATELVEAFKDSTVTPRGGLAYGSLVTRGGDYYGPIVNLASRIGALAIPSEILVTIDVAERSSFGFEPAGRRQLKGFADPVTLLSLSC